MIRRSTIEYSERGMKKRNLLLQNAEEVEERFRTRNLNDTRCGYITDSDNGVSIWGLLCHG